MKLRGKRVVVKVDLAGEKIGSIYIPERARQQPLVGEVVLIGENVVDVKVGDRVLFGSRSWSRFEEYGFPHVLLWAKDLLGVIEDDGAADGR